jgi:hypothetical protein
MVIPSGARNPYSLHGLLGVGILRFRKCFTSFRTCSAQDDRTKRSSAGDFCADVGLDLGFIGGEVEARGAIDAVSVEQCHGGHVEVLAHADQLLGQRSALEEAKCGAGVKLYKQVVSSRFSVLSGNLRIEFFAEN